MATLNMGNSYPLTLQDIETRIKPGRIGNYAYGYINNNGAFIVKYVGRSDSDLHERIKHGLKDMEENPSLKYERFKFSYAETIEEAYRKECQNYHDFKGDKGWLANKAHPSSPVGMELRCTICDNSD